VPKSMARTDLHDTGLWNWWRNLTGSSTNCPVAEPAGDEQLEQVGADHDNGPRQARAPGAGRPAEPDSVREFTGWDRRPSAATTTWARAPAGVTKRRARRPAPVPWPPGRSTRSVGTGRYERASLMRIWYRSPLMVDLTSSKGPCESKVRAPQRKRRSRASLSASVP
jgi:hypothetical protein